MVEIFHDVPNIRYDQWVDFIPLKDTIWHVEDLAVDFAYVVKDGKQSPIQEGDTTLLRLRQFPTAGL